MDRARRTSSALRMEFMGAEPFGVAKGQGTGGKPPFPLRKAHSGSLWRRRGHTRPDALPRRKRGPLNRRVTGRRDMTVTNMAPTSRLVNFGQCLVAKERPVEREKTAQSAG